MILLSSWYLQLVTRTGCVFPTRVNYIWYRIFVTWCLIPSLLSKPQLNYNSTQPQFNITLVLLDKKMTLHTTPPTHYPPRKINMSNISAVTDPILINFKCRLLGTSRKDSNSHGDICPGNICPGDVCPYQKYLSCYWLDFEKL